MVNYVRFRIATLIVVISVFGCTAPKVTEKHVDVVPPQG